MWKYDKCNGSKDDVIVMGNGLIYRGRFYKAFGYKGSEFPLKSASVKKGCTFIVKEGKANSNYQFGL